MKNEEEKKVQAQINKLIELCGGKTEEIKTIVGEIVDKVHNGKVEPMEFCVPLNKVKSRIKEKEYEMVKYENGIEYKVKGGFNIFVSPKCLSLYGALNFLFSILNGEVKSENDAEEDCFMGFVSAMSHILQAPIIASSDTNLMLSISNTIITYLNNMQEKLMNSELKEDDNPELTESMNDAILASHEIADELLEESKKLK